MGRKPAFFITFVTSTRNVLISEQMSKAIESKITELVTGEIDAAGYDLVRVKINGGGKYATLQIMAERKDGVGMKVEDCAKLSGVVSLKIEADADLANRFDLEVSSPGIDRPLTRIRDFERFQSHVAKVELDVPVEGQKRFQGKIGNVGGGEIEFLVDKKVLKTAFENIVNAKLVLTDELLKSSMKQG